jgi:hypothetical protein
MEMNRWFRKEVVSFGVVAALLGAGCGVGVEPVGADDEALEGDVDFSTLADSAADKADAISNRLAVILGPIAFGETKADTTGTRALFHAYTIKAKRGDRIELRAAASKRSRILLYGPKNRGGRWGSPIKQVTLSYGGGRLPYVGKIATALPGDGEYLVAIGSYTRGVSYELSLSCEAGSCAKKFCAEYEAADENGVTAERFYAFNVHSYEEGKAILGAQNGLIVNEAIRDGSCTDQGTICALYYAPVCGEVATTGAGRSTYGNLCALKAAIRQAAGATGQSKGAWDVGACKVTCTYGGATYNEGDSFPSTDGCNTCSCTTGGQVACTERACLACNPANDSDYRTYIGHSPAECATIRFFCEAERHYFSNDCGCGCEDN